MLPLTLILKPYIYFFFFNNKLIKVRSRILRVNDDDDEVH